MKFFDRESIPTINRIEAHPLSKDELKLFIEKYPWYQTFDFGDGIIAKGSHKSGEQVQYVLEDDMTGMRYVDIGSNQGHQVLSAAMRGAEAYGIDNKKKQIIQSTTIAKHFGIRAQFFWTDYMDVPANLRAEYLKGFDYITMMSVFHHFKRPMRALRIAKFMCQRSFVGEFACWIDGEKRWKKATILPEDWKTDYHRAFPTVDCMVKALHDVGFKKIKIIGELKAKNRIVIKSSV